MVAPRVTDENITGQSAYTVLFLQYKGERGAYANLDCSCLIACVYLPAVLVRHQGVY